MTSEHFGAVVIGAILLTYANGANDNFKGVATLYGSGVLSYRVALISATVATWLGSVAALVLAGELVRAFSGKGLVDPSILAQGAFPVAVAGGAALTVLLATRLGLPISTTHALIGALVGAGLSTGTLRPGHLVTAFALPLALSPLLAASLAAAVYLAGRTVRRHLQLEPDDCLCLGPAIVPAATSSNIVGPDSAGAARVGAPMSATATAGTLSTTAGHLRVGNAATCRSGAWSLPGISAVDGVGVLHCFSGLLLSFARGLNDTPKIAGVLLIGTSLAIGTQQWLIVAIASVMAIGGLRSARRVAEVMSKEITELDEGRGLAANLVTSFLVLGASKFGVPVSTTHVSCGALFGIGAGSKGGHIRIILMILGAWVITLPIGAAVAAIIYHLVLALAA